MYGEALWISLHLQDARYFMSASFNHVLILCNASSFKTGEVSRTNDISRHALEASHMSNTP